MRYSGRGDPKALLYFFAFATVVAVAWIVYRAIRSWWRQGQWIKVADEFDLHCDAPHYVLEGEHRGVFVKVNLSETERGTATVSQTEYAAAMGGLGIPPMRLKPEQRLLGINLDNMLKKTELEIGFKAIDDAFIINGPDKDAIREFFQQPGVGSAFLRCVRAAKGRVSYDKGRLRITHDGIASQRRLTANLDALADCAQALAQAGKAQLAARAHDPADADAANERGDAVEAEEAASDEKFGW